MSDDLAGPAATGLLSVAAGPAAVVGGEGGLRWRASPPGPAPERPDADALMAADRLSELDALVVGQRWWRRTG
ncbi:MULTISPECIES: hypothetical protein [Streptomyces]|uniref:hypothetical protein n=2 Tax=Streptomyces TaxID=1883 RepID=UPI000D51BC24|nr:MULTISPECIES: hypothetical protein [Streptomyces]PVC63277.1 hypothetical protein DBP15_30340 [Streptomyces sp. CS065A]